MDQERSRLPDAFPSWSRELGELYHSGTTSVFLLHGNVHDPVRSGEARWGPPLDFLAEQIFGRWDLVLAFDLARGLRVFAGANGERLREMVTLASKRIGDFTAIKRDPGAVLATIDAFLLKNLLAEDKQRLSVAVLVEHLSTIVPAGEPARLSPAHATNLVTILNWASSPYLKRQNFAFVGIDESRSAVSERLLSHPSVAALEIPLPDEDDRRRFVEASGQKSERAIELGRLTAGMGLSAIEILVRQGADDRKRLASIKKGLIERQCHGLIEFVEPKWTLDVVAGHEAAKSRLADDAKLLAKGQLDGLPMGYLFCGPVGTGKTFLAQCAAGSLGVPCLVLKNFRSKYVGETEGNLERVLQVLRAMGPVVVVIDEADAALGDRGGGGDSGTSNRVFAMIAAQMGDTRYRGRILWMLLTCRPDLLPIDLKRQGRAEVHVPLFYPQEEGELRELFVAMARKLELELAAADIPPILAVGELSGADVEGIVGRAARAARLAGHRRVTKADLEQALAEFLPSTEGLEKELQELAAVLECSERRFLTPRYRALVDEPGGRVHLQERMVKLSRMIEAS